MGVEDEVQQYLRTGDYDITFAAWPGNRFEKRGAEDLKAALVAEVQRRAGAVEALPALPHPNLVAYTRRKVGPMVRGLFTRSEQDSVLRVLERSVVFLTPANVASVLAAQRWLRTAWDLANLYLGSVGADVLGPDAEPLVGLSEETTCYVSMEYFDQNDRFADFIVHEAAHIFHNCKRETIGLPETRTREWLQDIDFKRRETFAYACEAYSRILELGATRLARFELLDELLAGDVPSDPRIDRDCYVDVLRRAVTARNGWKRIRDGCSSSRFRTRTSATTMASTARGAVVEAHLSQSKDRTDGTSD